MDDAAQRVWAWLSGWADVGELEDSTLESPQNISLKKYVFVQKVLFLHVHCVSLVPTTDVNHLLLEIFTHGQIWSIDMSWHYL